MARRITLLGLALAFFVCSTPWGDSVGPSIAAAVPMSRETEASLPGLEDDPLMRKVLKCNACHVVLTEVIPTLRLERAKKRRDLNPDEFITVMEKGCAKMRVDFGLQMRNNKVTPVYSKHKEVSRAEGSWISNYLVTTCGQITGDYDEVLKAAAFGEMKADELRTRVCQVDKSKTSDDDANGLNVCPEDVDWERVNTHNDGWSSTGETYDTDEDDKPVEVDEEKEL